MISGTDTPEEDATGLSLWAASVRRRVAAIVHFVTAAKEFCPALRHHKKCSNPNTVVARTGVVAASGRG